MHGALPFVIFVLIVVFIIVGAIHTHKKAEERRAALTVFAAQRGWEFDAMKNRNIRHQFEGAALFGRGSDRFGENALYGKHEGRDVLMFDYHYETTSGSGKDRRTHHHWHGVVALRSNFLLKPLEIRPEGLWDKLTSAFGCDDIDFESAEFSRHYHVSGPDRRWAYDVINPRTMELLLSREKLTLSMTNTHILFTKSGQMGPESMMEALGLCAAVLDGIPDFARESLT